MKRILLIAGMLILLLSGAANKSQVIDNTPVEHLDLGRSMGRWYEIARIDNRFEKGMQYVSAYYSMAEDNTIRVANKGTRDGYRKLTIAKAKRTDYEGIFRVSFFPPFYRNLRILYVSEDYESALVGSDRENRLWILSRNPQMSDEDASILLQDAMARGYDIGQLSWVLQ